MRLFWLFGAVCLAVTLRTPLASAAPDEAAEKTAPGVPPYTIPAGELGLEGTVSDVNGATGAITIAATAFSTPTGRKIIEPAKPKLLITTGETLIFDERTGRVLEFSDIVPGLAVRVVGRNIGTGQPLRARLLLWRSPRPAAPPDAGVPAAIQELLPPPATWKGIEVRVFNAGFASQKQIYPEGQATAPAFFLGYNVSVPTDFPDAAKWYNYVRLRSVTAPDGEKFGLPNASHFENGNYYPEVDPRWKSVTANFELTLPNAPPGADGRFEDKYHFETPLPTRENPTLEPNQTVTTPHGTTYTLKKIATDFAQGRTTITVGVRPADVPGADAWMRSAVAIAVVDGQVNQPNLNTSGNAAEEIYDFPALASAARTLELFFTGGEIAPAWKSPDFFRALDIEVPVAALVKANPPAVTTMGALPSYFAENSRFSARLDITENNASGVQSTLWLRPEKAPGATNTAVRQVPEVTAVRALTADGTSVRIYPIERKAAVFHNDGSAPAPDETSIALELPRFGSTPAGPVQLQFDINSSAQLAREYGPRDVPIPPLGSPALAAPDSKGSVRLQRMAQVEAGSALAAQILQRTAGKIDLGAHNACLMVFDVERALPDSSFVLSDLILDGVALKSYQSGLWNGNALADQKSGAVTLILAQQAVKSAPIHFDLIEKTVGKPEPMLVLKDVEIKAPQK